MNNKKLKLLSFHEYWSQTSIILWHVDPSDPPRDEWGTGVGPSYMATPTTESTTLTALKKGQSKTFIVIIESGKAFSKSNNSLDI